jgi:glucose-6-phosphate 1-dehydrogenase
MEKLRGGIFYTSGDINDPDAYRRMSELLDQIDRERGTCSNRIYYLSVMPTLYGEAIRQLKEAGLAQPKSGAWTRIVIEKPFGHDLASADRTERAVAAVFHEDQVYRIDHYLGKETVQNLLVFRFANGIFEPIWNRQYIDHVQLTNAEAIGLEGRGAYYDTAGVLRDMIQNHVFQVLSLVAMEPPVSPRQNAVRDEKIKAMQAVRCDSSRSGGRVRGAGPVRPRFGCREAGCRLQDKKANVNPESSTETYAALKLYFDNWRWAGVPFYIRSGKRMPKRVTEIAIQFKQAPHLLFSSISQQQLEPNVLVIRIQPDEGITLRIGAQGARTGNAHSMGKHGFSLRRVVRSFVPRSLRAAVTGLHAWRPQSLCQARYDGARLGDRNADTRGLAEVEAGFPELRGWNLGTEERGRFD